MNHREEALNALKGLRAESQEILKKVLSDPGFRGVIGGKAAQELMSAEGIMREEFLLKLLPLARTFSRPPISNYFVGAVMEGNSGNLYLGANIEIPGQPLGLAVHAEQAAAANAYNGGESGIRTLAVTASPCGHCRQFLNELMPGNELLVLRADAGPAPLSALLPMAFGPKNLGMTRGALPPEQKHLTFKASAQDQLSEAALKAARRAYAPYSKSPSGAAIRIADGRIYGGSYLENAAFNPSLPPLQAALAGVFASGADASAIKAAVLVEIEGATISQDFGTRATLAGIAPTAGLKVLKAMAG